MSEHLTDVRDSHRRICDSVGRISDAEMRQPSLLPAWTRDMLVAHLRFAADAASRAVAGIREGTAAVMYPGGDAQREEETTRAAGAPPDELAADLRGACSRLDDAFASLRTDMWHRPVQTRRGPVPLREVLLQRWIDVEAHHVDLDIGYSPSDWPQSLVDAYLPGLVEVMVALRQRPDVDRSVTGSWHLRRTDGAGEWTLRTDGLSAVVVHGHEKSDAAISGTGRQLMALLLGRVDTGSLDVLGDEELASALKRAFPGP